MENTDSWQLVQFQNRLVSLRSVEKWSRVWQFSNHLSLRQNTQFWKAGVPGEYLLLHRLIGYRRHLLCLITCVILNITASHPPPKDKVQNMKLKSLRFHGGLQFSSAFQAEEQEWLEGWLTLPKGRGGGSPLSRKKWLCRVFLPGCSSHLIIPKHSPMTHSIYPHSPHQSGSDEQDAPISNAKSLPSNNHTMQILYIEHKHHHIKLKWRALMTDQTKYSVNKILF